MRVNNFSYFSFFLLFFLSSIFSRVFALLENQEKFYLYLIISVTAGVVLCLMIVITRLILNRRRNDGNSENGKTGGGHFKNSNTGETTITNGFSADDISEIDADIDLTTPLPMPSVSRNDVSH